MVLKNIDRSHLSSTLHPQIDILGLLSLEPTPPPLIRTFLSSNLTPPPDSASLPHRWVSILSQLILLWSGLSTSSLSVDPEPTHPPLIRPLYLILSYSLLSLQWLTSTVVADADGGDTGFLSSIQLSSLSPMANINGSGGCEWWRHWISLLDPIVAPF